MNQNGNGKAKEAFSVFFKKTTEVGKKAADGAKILAEQTKKHIYEVQAKKYTAITAKDFKSKSFGISSVIEIVDNSAKRDIISQPSVFVKHFFKIFLNIFSPSF